MNGQMLPVGSLYQDRLRDESRLCGSAATISFPAGQEEVRQQMEWLAAQKIPVTVQGARTGICGAAVPRGGHILDLGKLDRVLGLRGGPETGLVLEVQPGVSLSIIREGLSRGAFPGEGWDETSRETAKTLRSGPVKWRLAPDPTEETATIGGLFCCNAKGPNARRYGTVGDHVTEVTVVLADGRCWEIPRGRFRFRQGGCPLPDGGRLALGELPACPPVSRPLFPYEGMDLVDLFAGSEGMLGVVTRLALQLSPAPVQSWGVLFFFSDEDQPVQFALQAGAAALEGASLTAGEFYDGASLRQIQKQKDLSSRLKELPDIPPYAGAAVYLELEGEEEEGMEEALLLLSELFAGCGGREEDTWAACGPGELEKLRLLRHTAPESANHAIDEARRQEGGITKLCADIAFPPERLEEWSLRYRRDIRESGIPGVVFGHILEGHLHVNLLPATLEEHRQGQGMIEGWCAAAVAQGGRVADENGIGKQKRDWFLGSVTPEQLEAARKIKAFFDPEGLLNPGNML